MKKIITCASYGGTGSSAITDLLKEFRNCKSFGDFEFSFLHYPNGVRDLELNILNRNNRLNTGYSIYKFLEMNKKIEKAYLNYFGSDFLELSENYIKNISNISWKGTSELYSNDENLILKFMYRVVNKILRIIVPKKEGLYFQKKNYKMFCSYVSEEKFYKETKKYLEELFQRLKVEKEYENLVLDQLIPSSDINSYLNYFDDIKVIVVDRDPRDLYILNREFWKEGWIPEDIDTYIEYFKIIREHQNYEEENKEKILRIKFEDLIYFYDDTLNDIIKFLGLDERDHILKKKYFDPQISIKNTNLRNKYSKYSAEIKKIEEKLKKFCYEGSKR